MPMTRKELREEVMKLPTQERLQLADEIYSSAAPESEEAIERLWIAEAERRLDEILSGEVEAVDGEEAMRRIRATIHEKI